LINISPKGQLSEIFSELIEVNKVYGTLQKGQYATTVKQIPLETGQEYFKAIVTSEPIDWETFITMATKGKSQIKFWNAEELIVNVE